MTGQSISHQAAWNVVQQLGESIEEHETNAATLATKNEGKGTLETKVLFQKADGIWLHMQGKSREKHGSSHEMKLSIAYDGAEPIGSNRYRLTNKVADANFESGVEFAKRMEGVIAETYDVDEIETRILNGDGASWIKSCSSGDTTQFQLDVFHRNEAIVRAAPDENSRKTMFKLLYGKEIKDLLIYIDELASSVEDKKQEKKLRDLYTYLTNNQDGLVSYKQHGLNLPETPEGIAVLRIH